MRRHLQRGFTLVEIMLVIMIVGILAAIVIPQFVNATAEASNNSISSTLTKIRSQLEVYKAQHGDQPPATTLLWTNLITYSDTAGSTSASSSTTYRFGPYFLTEPKNPANNLTIVASAPSTTVGWVYTMTGNQCTIQAVDTFGTTVLPY